MSLDSSQRAALDRDGYVVVPGALDPRSVEQLRLAFEHAPQQSGTQHVEVTADLPGYAAWQALATHPALIEAADHVLARAYEAPQVHGRNPLPGFGLQGLHTDWIPRAQGEPYYVVTAICMLDPFAADNGATRVVPGSHLVMRPLPKPLAQPNAHHPAERTVTGTAGSLLVFNGHLWHAGQRNDSTRPRRAAQLVVIAKGARQFKKI